MEFRRIPKTTWPHLPRNRPKSIISLIIDRSSDARSGAQILFLQQEKIFDGVRHTTQLEELPTKEHFRCCSLRGYCRTEDQVACTQDLCS